MTLMDRLLFMVSDRNPDNIHTKFSGMLITVLVILSVFFICLHYFGECLCYFYHIKLCTRTPKIFSGLFLITILSCISFICYRIFRGLIIIFNDFKSSFKTNEEIVKLLNK